MDKVDKKEKILDSAQCLMLDKGYVATTVDEICESAGVTKGSFFYYFKDKEEMGKEMAQRFSSRGKQCCEGLKGEADPLKRVHGLLDMITEISKTADFKGCIMGIFSQELSETHPEIRKICETSFDGFISNLEKDLAQAKDKYAPKSSFKPREVAEYFLATFQGAMVLARAKKDKKIVERALSQFREHLRMLYKK
ncbi:MAG: TetR/AcrR family transcriptional regulator [Nitrospina sp.]|mgnify:FL=1|nr:TetR/AcrR family transcriptional regulator [Nitrospina sp.]MBT3414536.1 TetR/AcrR family transcriptional regulator [Nitrospina sp.]MBT3857667.1 TetR/AcrR family transcriptional regulator [Nitrospina sp.]MBT4105078.1 TetR/AcrR family transcriptional regulator [Nitrospina sp.]MBT4389330.1 TetR/AcrR family transcriptional regulator [Nitrospina sp.]